MSRLFLGALLLGSLMSAGTALGAEEVEEFDVEAASPVNPDRPQPRDESWYYHPSTEPTVYKPNPTQIVQQRAMARGQQRDARLASCALVRSVQRAPDRGADSLLLAAVQRRCGSRPTATGCPGVRARRSTSWRGGRRTTCAKTAGNSGPPRP